MNIKLVAVLLMFFTSSINAQQRKFAPAHFGLCYPISTNGKQAIKYTNGLSLHAIGGMSYRENALCISGLSSYVFDRANGAMIAGFSNHVRHNMRGAMIAGFMNTVRYATKGVQVAGYINMSGYTKGAQIAGGINIALDSVKGVQVAGLINIAANKTSGTQIAGLINTAKKTEGVQIAGLINVNKVAKGVSIAGLINIADSCDYPIAPINIIRNGHKSIGITTYDGTTNAITFRSGGRIMYGLIGIGYYQHQETSCYLSEAGIGAQLHLYGKINLNLETSITSYTSFDDDIMLKSSVRALPTLNFARRFAVFAGPSLNHVWTNDGAITKITENYTWSQYTRNNFNGIYIGFVGGIQYNL